MSFVRPSLSQLIARAQADIESRLPGADSRLRRNSLDVLARVHAGAMHEAYGYLDDIARFLPDIAESDRLSRWASIFGLTRKAAVAATGVARLIGINDVVIPAGTLLQRVDGARYLVREDVTIETGIADAPIEAETSGAGGVAPTGQQLTFVSPIAGVQATASVLAPGVSGGLEEESDDALRVRLLERIRNEPAGGKPSDYIRWAKEIAGVTRVWVYGNTPALGQVSVLFVMDDRDTIIPEAGDIAAVAAHIATRRPVTAQVSVAGPVDDPLDFSLHITPDTSAVRAAVTAELRDLIRREAEPGGTLLISHIREAISLAAGESDHVLATPSANVTVSAGHIHTLGDITWT